MSEWRLLGELVAFNRDIRVVPDALRPLLDFVELREPRLVLDDPALAPGQNWLRPMTTVGTEPVRFLQCITDGTPPMVRYYVPASAGTGFRAEVGRHEGHWRQFVDEDSELPWPMPSPDWFERGRFLVQLDGVEARATRIAYRGLSHCRLCGRVNGHEAFQLGLWEWPVGFRHYVADHLVRPTDAFVDFVRAAEPGHGGRK